MLVGILFLFIMLVVFKMGIYALVGSNIVFSICMCFLNQRAISRACGYRQEIEFTFLRPLIAAGIMGVVTYVTYLCLDLLVGGRVIPASISILVAVIVYAATILRLRVLSPREIAGFPQGRRLLRLCRRLHLLPNDADE